VGSRYAGSEDELRALNAYINLVRAANTVTAKAHGPLQDAGLTIGQFAALDALFHLGPMRQNELASKLLSSPGNLSTVLTNLQRRRLVNRVEDTRDGRCTRVVLTDKGRKLIGGVFPHHAARLASVMQGLADDELHQLRVLCRKLGRGAH
jgi:MarR family 2-MHQ and catechol resistance regulon transcriptional repressor